MAKKAKRKAKLGRPSKDTPDWSPAFLEGIVAGLHVRDACERAGIDGSRPYARRQTDPEFKKAWADATWIGTKTLESEAARRAYHGTLKPVFQKGEQVGSIREYSDTLLMFLLRARRPKKYRDNSKVEHTGANGGAIPIQVLGVEIVPPTAPAPQQPEQ